MTPETTPIVIIESPYAGDVERNTIYLRMALRDSLMRGEAPYASHSSYTQEGVLDDRIPAERDLGIQVGFVFRFFAIKTVVYEDLGISAGMQLGIDHSVAIGVPVEYRQIGKPVACAASK